MANSAGKTSNSDKRVTLMLSPAMMNEVDRIIDLTDLKKAPDVFRTAFTLLRIHVDAAQKGKEILIVDPENPDQKLMIALPFTVERPDSRGKGW